MADAMRGSVKLQIFTFLPLDSRLVAQIELLADICAAAVTQIASQDFRSPHVAYVLLTLH